MLFLIQKHYKNIQNYNLTEFWACSKNSNLILIFRTFQNFFKIHKNTVRDIQIYKFCIFSESGSCSKNSKLFPKFKNT